MAASQAHPDHVLFQGEKPFPILPAVDHYAGSEKLMKKALTVQHELGAVFDITCDCEDGAHAGAEREHAEMAANVIMSDDNLFNRVGARVHDVTHPHWHKDMEILVGIAGSRLPFITLPKPRSAGDVQVQIEALRDIGDKFKADYLVNVLVGKTTALIKSYGHNKSKWFGAGAEHDARFWGAVLRQALILGLIDKNIENYGLISVNKKGEGYIALPFPVTVTLDHDYDEEEKESESVAPMGKGGAADEELFSMLKDLRKKVAKQHGLPPFVIFQDPSLEDMAVQYPITIEEMQNISGVGVGKARKFGEEFIRLIKAYVEEKEIIRPQDMIVKSVGNKSGNKIFIIQSIDRKMDFEDIARAKDLDFDELLTEIEGIVNSGTKLDISYYLRDFMDEDKIEDIYLYFKEDAQSDSLDAAIDELGADYTEEEIRLVRIKFICEQGN